jgi:very-short-patch-repair endonuclease
MTASAKLDHALLAGILHRQQGVIARGQVIRCGMTERALLYRIRPGGSWQRLLPGVYLAETGTSTTDQRDLAALLYAGPGSVITASAAMRRLGLRTPSTSDVDVLVPAAMQRQSLSFVKLHRTTRMPDLFCVSGPIRFAMAPRAVADAARGLKDLREVRAVVAGSVQQDWCRIAELAKELDEGPMPGSARFRRVLAEVAVGVRSPAEAEFCDLLISAGLPMPMFNARLYIGDVLIAIADAWWPDAGIAAEVDSRAWHLSAEDWEQTLQRHALMTAKGILVLHFTPKQVRTEPAYVITTLRAALDAGRNASRLRVRALPATA